MIDIFAIVCYPRLLSRHRSMIAVYVDSKAIYLYVNVTYSIVIDITYYNLNIWIRKCIESLQHLFIKCSTFPEPTSFRPGHKMWIGWANKVILYTKLGLSYVFWHGNHSGKEWSWMPRYVTIYVTHVTYLLLYLLSMLIFCPLCIHTREPWHLYTSILPFIVLH